MPAGQALGSWVEQPMPQINGKSRQWWIWLPTGYDPKHAYPAVFTFHGCGGPDNIIPMQKVTGADAIVVRGTGITDSCWTYGANGDDVKFFDFMLADLEAKRCIDRSRVFTSGYSSGAWLVNTLNCQRGDKLRGSGSVSGGVAVDTSKCPGGANPTPGVKPKEFARIFIHDADDTTNKFVGNGNDKELARLLTANHCMPTDPVPEDPAPCARYQGCDAGMPVVMCKTTGKNHDRQDTLATTAFWKFFSSLCASAAAARLHLSSMTTLDAGTWLNEPKVWKRADGVLEVTTDHGTDFWRETHYGFTRHSGHFLALPTGNAFTAQLRIQASYQALYDQAGIMLLLDEQRWLKAGIELSDGRAMLSSVLTDRRSDWATGPYEHDPRDFLMRLTVGQGVLRVQVSADGRHWPLVRLAPFPEAAVYQVGPMCCTPERAGLAVRFSEFRLSAPLGKELHDLS